MSTPPAQAKPANRLLGADWARALGVIGVILIHEEYYPGQGSGFSASFYPAVDMLARFSVPLFVILTGIMLGFREGAYASVSQFLKRRLSRSLIPWLIWAPVWYLIGVSIQPVIVNSCLATFAHCSEQFFLYGAGHLYFLLIVPQLYLLFLIWPKTRNPRLAAAVVAMLVQVVIYFIRLYAPAPGGIVDELLWWHGTQLFFFWIGDFAIGVFIGGEIKRGVRLPGHTWQWLLASIGSAALVLGFGFGSAPHFNPFLTGIGAFGHPFIPLWTLTLLGLFWIWGRNRQSKVIDQISLYSLGIYIVHPFFLPYTTNIFLPMAMPWSILGSAIQVGLVLGGAYVVVRLIAATPLASIVGNQRTPITWPSRGKLQH